MVYGVFNQTVMHAYVILQKTLKAASPILSHRRLFFRRGVTLQALQAQNYVPNKRMY